MKSLEVGTAILFALAFIPSGATAQPLHLSFEGVENPERLADALAGELERPLTTEAGRPALRVVVSPGTEATLTYTLEDGSERTRTLPLSDDREAALAELILLASNLVRDQTQDLIMAPAGATAPVEETAAPSREPAGASVPRPDALAARSFAEEHPLHLGVAGFVGLRVDSSDNVQPFGSYGLSFSGTIAPFASIGLTRLSLGMGFSSLEGVVFALEGTPFVEVFNFVDRHVQVYGQLGVALQGRSQTAVQEGLFQAAPFLGAGARFYTGEHFSIGVELGAHLVVTDAYFMMGASLPQLSVPATFGVSAEWHITP